MSVCSNSVVYRDWVKRCDGIERRCVEHIMHMKAAIFFNRGLLDNETKEDV